MKLTTVNNNGVRTTTVFITALLTMPTIRSKLDVPTEGWGSKLCAACGTGWAERGVHDVSRGKWVQRTLTESSYYCSYEGLRSRSNHPDGTPSTEEGFLPRQKVPRSRSWKNHKKSARELTITLGNNIDYASETPTKEPHEEASTGCPP